MGRRSQRLSDSGMERRTRCRNRGYQSYLHHRFFQLSAFNDSQVISVYYQVKPLQMPSCDFQTKPLNFKQLGHEECLFRWIPIQQLTMQDLTLPIDKQIVSLIKQLNKEE